MMANNGFKELAKAKIQDKRNIVISENLDKGGFELAQQLVVTEGSKQTLIFIKGSIHIDNLEGIYLLRDACNEIIKKCENN